MNGKIKIKVSPDGVVVRGKSIRVGGSRIIAKIDYPILGEVIEDEKGTWKARCGCSGYIDENFDAVVTENCVEHRTLRRVKWQAS